MVSPFDRIEVQEIVLLCLGHLEWHHFYLGIFVVKAGHSTKVLVVDDALGPTGLSVLVVVAGLLGFRRLELLLPDELEDVQGG